MFRPLRARIGSSLFIVTSLSAAFVLVTGLLSSCSSDDAPAAATPLDAAGAQPDGAKKKTDGSTDDDDTEDAGQDVHAPPIILPTCVGGSLPMNVSGVRAFVNIPIGSVPDGGPDAGYVTKGDFVLDYGTTNSTIDLKAFGDAGSDAPVPSYCNGDAAAPGAICTFQGFDFFGDWGQVYLVTADHSTLFGAVRQAGIVATDFLSKNPFTLDFTNKLIYRSDVTKFCTDTQLLAAGFNPLSAKGFFTTHPEKVGELIPLSQVLDQPDADLTNVTVPNVPTVAINVAGVRALAQLDTGYEDRLERRSININEALFEKLNATPGLLTRDALIDLYVTTCAPGVNEQLEGYHLTDGSVFEFVGEGGSVARTELIKAVYLKHRRADTYKCGGISTWTSAAAQIGASFFIDAQALIIDPTASRVWIPKN